jgi:hypothetical protein
MIFYQNNLVLLQSIMDTDTNVHNGLITKIWGSAGWTFGHCVAEGYPISPTPAIKMQYRSFFESLGDVLPCVYCRDSYKKFITSGKTILNDSDLESRDTLVGWFFRIHEAVNEKLEMDYGVTLEEVRKRYGSFRAKCSSDPNIKGCVSPLDHKAFSFRNLYELDPPLITIESARRFIPLAYERKIPESCLKFFEMAEKMDIVSLKKCKVWDIRRKLCRKIIKKMRVNGIPSIDSNGLPSFMELVLITMLSSNLNKSELNLCAQKIDIANSLKSR